MNRKIEINKALKIIIHVLNITNPDFNLELQKERIRKDLKSFGTHIRQNRIRTFISNSLSNYITLNYGYWTLNTILPLINKELKSPITVTGESIDNEARVSANLIYNNKSYILEKISPNEIAESLNNFLRVNNILFLLIDIDKEVETSNYTIIPSKYENDRLIRAYLLHEIEDIQEPIIVNSTPKDELDAVLIFKICNILRLELTKGDVYRKMDVLDLILDKWRGDLSIRWVLGSLCNERNACVTIDNRRMKDVTKIKTFNNVIIKTSFINAKIKNLAELENKEKQETVYIVTSKAISRKLIANFPNSFSIVQ